MCWKCDQIDRHIEHYRDLSDRITDVESARSLDILMSKLEARKSEIHIVEFKPPEKTAPPH